MAGRCKSPLCFTYPREGEGFDFEKQIRSMDLATQQRIFSFFDPVIYGAAAVEGHLVICTGHELFCVRDT